MGNEEEFMEIRDSFIDRSSDRESQGLSVIVQFPIVSSGDDQDELSENLSANEAEVSISSSV